MAHVEKRTHTAKDGKKAVYWRARYEDPSGNRRSKNFDRKLDAERFLIEIQANVLRGDYVDPLAGRRLFEDVAREWQRQQVHRPTTAAQVDSHLRRNILPHFGDRAIAQIRPSEVQAWVKDRAQHLAPGTVEVVYRFLGSIFRMAVDDGLIAKTPCRGVKLPKVERPRVVPPPTEQVHALNRGDARAVSGAHDPGGRDRPSPG